MRLLLDSSKGDRNWDGVMVFRLETNSVLPYLVQQGLSQPEQHLTIEPKMGKNFNLLVRLANAEAADPTVTLLLKQEPFRDHQPIKTGLRDEWRVYAMLRSHPPLHALQAFVSDAVQFDPQNGILIYRFLEPYHDLSDFYTEAQTIPSAIAAVLGATLATLHQATFQQQDYQHQIDPDSVSLDAEEEEVPDFRGGLTEITPSIFKQVTLDGLKFYELYQRYDSLDQAIARLEDDYRPCCLIHNDLKFNNILLHQDWATWNRTKLPAPASALQLDQDGVVRLIDWERAMWGDPALDVGAIAAEYLKIWLNSLMLSRDINIEVALRLAAVPLEDVQPSLAAFLHAYLAQFPKILDTFPDFVERVLRFTGLALIESIQARLHYREPFGNVEICMLQVAKSLLCNPRAAQMTVFGQPEFDPTAFDPALIQFQTESFPSASTQPEEDSAIADVPPPEWIQTYAPDRVLTDLVNHIHVDATTISHPAYVPLDLAHKAGDRYRQLPNDLQQTYLLRQVRNYLYDIYFSGEQEQRSPQPDIVANLKNNAIAGLDIDFYERIQTANAGTGFTDPDWTVTRIDGDRLQVVKAGLHLWVNGRSDLDLTMVQQDGIEVGTVVPLRLPKAQLTGDYYRAIANAGEPSAEHPGIELYFHVTPDGAIALMDAFTSALNQYACPFTFKILTDPTDYGRFDAGILHVERSHYVHVASVLQAVYPKVRSQLSNPIPLFTKLLAPGIGLAEDPEEDSDFGLSRCRMVAQALLDASDASSRLALLRQYFKQQQVDWHHPYLNPGSTDQYSFNLST